MHKTEKLKPIGSRRAAPSGEAARSGQRHLHDAQLYERLPELQLIYDTAPVGLAFLSLDCRYVQINQRLTEICGISVADHIGRSVRETVPAVAEQVEQLVQVILHTGEPVTGVEVRGQKADKSNADHVWITNWHPLRNADGIIIGINVVAEDITERKRAESALRELNETLEQRVRAETHERLQIWNVSQDLLVIADADGKLLNVNPAWTSVLGWPEAELIGKTTQWLLHPDDREKARVETKQLAAGHVTHRFTTRFLHRDGSYRWLSWKAVQDKGHIYAMARDVTELRDAENKLMEARQELAQVSRRTTLAAMSAAIAHEIRQPLGAIVTNANAGLRWLDRATPDLGEVRDSLKQISADGHRASEVIQSVRAMFGKSDPVGTPLDANELVLETIAMANDELEAAKIDVQLELAGQLPLIPAHRGQLQQVVLNIVTNAAESMRNIDDRARTLRVRSRPFDSNGVALSVQDCGAGIDPKNMERIFDAFFTTKANGMGMGLAICRSIVEAHGGTLSASPGVPYGSIFHIVLPGIQ
ncbi:MAG: PAS domain-containing protein [Pseudolabrys sp.]